MSAPTTGLAKYRDGVRRGIYAAPHVIAWRALWWVPVQAVRSLFTALIFVAYGPKSASRAWRATW